MGDYEKDVIIRHALCGADKRLKSSSMLLEYQEIANEDVERLGLGKEKTWDKGLLWVMARQRFLIHRMPLYREEVKFSTWPNGVIRFLYPRSYAAYAKDGSLLIEGTSIWTLIDATTRKPIIPEERGLLVEDGASGRPFEMPSSVRCPLFLPQKAELEAKWSLCDPNGHLNNAKYLDACEDLIPADFLLSHPLKGLEIDYRKEIPLGEKVTLSYGEKEGSYFFRCDSFHLRLIY